MGINFFSTTLNKTILKELNKLFKKGFISSGKKSDEFENKFSKKFGLKYATAVNSGTSALHLALLCANVKRMMNNFTCTNFCGHWICSKILWCKASFRRYSKNTGNICPLSIEKDNKKNKSYNCGSWEISL